MLKQPVSSAQPENLRRYDCAGKRSLLGGDVRADKDGLFFTELHLVEIQLRGGERCGRPWRPEALEGCAPPMTPPPSSEFQSGWKEKKRYFRRVLRQPWKTQ